MSITRTPRPHRTPYCRLHETTGRWCGHRPARFLEPSHQLDTDGALARSRVLRRVFARPARSCRRCQGAEWVHATHARQRYCYRSSAGRHHPSSGTGGITARTISSAPRAAAITLPQSSASPWSHSMPGGVLRLAAALALSRASALTCQACRRRLAAVSPPIPVAPTTRAARLLRPQASPLLLIVTPTSDALCDAAGGAVTRADIIECVG